MKYFIFIHIFCDISPLACSTFYFTLKNKMGLRKKFNLLLVICLALSFFVIYWCHKESVLLKTEMNLTHQAEIAFEITESIRTYNENEVRPLINNANSGFLPQTVGSYAATQVMKSVTKMVPSLHYKVAIDETEIDIYKPNIWQQNIIEQFKNDSTLPIINDKVADEEGRFLVYAKPILTNDKVVGTKIVRINEEDLYSAVDKNVFLFSGIVLGLLFAVFIFLNLVMNILVFKPLNALAEQSNKISQGQSKIEELEVSGQDEINQVAASFNRMQRSLKAAMGMLS